MRIIHISFGQVIWSEVRYAARFYSGHRSAPEARSFVHVKSAPVAMSLSWQMKSAALLLLLAKSIVDTAEVIQVVKKLCLYLVLSTILVRIKQFTFMMLCRGLRRFLSELETIRSSSTVTIMFSRAISREIQVLDAYMSTLQHTALWTVTTERDIFMELTWSLRDLHGYQDKTSLILIGALWKRICSCYKSGGLMQSGRSESWMEVVSRARRKRHARLGWRGVNAIIL